jgi:hypothetical protein
MSMWPIVFIIIAVAMAVGPIMMMQPSARDRRLANLRQKAAALGLQVRMTDIIWDQKKRSVAIYNLPVDLPKGTLAWCLLRGAYKHDIHFDGEWQWRSPTEQAPTEYHEQLHAFIKRLPSDIVGIDINRNTVGLLWLEQSSELTVEQLKDWLEECTVILSKQSALEERQ